MEGVKILSCEQILVDAEFNWIVFLAIILLFIAVGISVLYYCQDLESFRWCFISGIVISFICGACFCTPTEYLNQYKVSVSDDVSFVEFMDKYEIIETEGQIYTVKERKWVK